MRAAYELNPAEWRKSSYSGGEKGDACIEVATDSTPGVVGVRDSKDPEGPALTFVPAAWATFVAAVKAGELPTA